MSKRTVRASSPWLLLLLLAAVVGQAQEPPGEAEPPEDALIVEDEVEVTAQRVEQKLQDVPISIVTVSGEDMADRGIGDAHALADAAPGVVMSGHSPVSGESSLFVRGVGSNTSGLGVEAAVGYYVDGVYMPRPQSLLGSFFDLERAEVLRGPQGTLWGRNSTGGAIHLVTRAPEPEFHGTMRASLRRYDSPEDADGRSYGLSLTGPLTERLWGRVAGTDLSVEDATWNEHLRRRTKNLDGFSGRGALSLLAGPALTFTLRADTTNDDSHHNFHLKPGDTSPRSIVGTLVRFYGLSDPADVHRAASGELPFSAFEESGISLHAYRTFGNRGLNLTSISSAREFASNRRADVDGTALSYVDTAGSYESEWWSQEFQLQGATRRTNFVFGLYGFGEDGHHLTDARTDPALLQVWFVAGAAPIFGLNPDTYCSILDPTLCGPAFYEYLARDAGFALPGSLVTANRFDTLLDSVSYAAYGQVDWALGDRLTLTTGVRYTRDDKDYSLETLTQTGGLATEELADSWRRVTPKLGLEFRPRDALLFYAAASSGYKSGGFNAVSFQPSFGPETMNSYEVGFKVSSRRGVTLNASAFSYDYDDMQVEVLHLDHSYVANAAESGARGIDLDLRVRPNDKLAFDLSMEFLDDEFESFDSRDPGAIAKYIQAGASVLGSLTDFDSLFDAITLIEELEAAAEREVDLSGNSLPRAPDLSATVSLSYRTDVGRRGALTARGEYHYTDDVAFDPFARFEQPGYGLLHGNLRWDSPRQRFSVNLYGRNLTDEEYRLTEFHTNYTTSLRVWAPPREVGVQLGFDF
jgi:iron complex outermembrane receptor protein